MERVNRFYTEVAEFTDENDHRLDRVYHATVKKVTNDIDTLNFNTAISQMMIFINECYKTKTIYRPFAIGFLKMFACFAPHLGEELWATIFDQKDSITYEPWPTYDEAMLVDKTVTIVVQVNGKVRGKFEAAADTEEAKIQEQALQLENVQHQLEGKTVRKVIVVKGKVVNIVAN